MTETPTPATTQDGADPSMEDILASIRRILNEEETPASSEAPNEAPADDDVLVLDETMIVPGEMVPEGPEPAVRGADPEPGADASVARVEAPRHEEVVVASVLTEMTGLPARTPDLVAPETAAAAASSVGNLMRTLAAGRSTQVYSGGPTLEDIVRAELRPLLKDWLDTNLPPLVERLVRAEIERVVGRAVP